MKKKVHFIGICGAGMSAVAILMKESGWLVSGSDDNFYPPVSDYIKKSHIKFFKGYNKNNLPIDINAIVIGKHDGLTPEINEEVRLAFALKAPKYSFAQVLGKLTEKRKNIVIAGSYGKSTCTALASWCLEYANKKPGYFIGAITKTPAKSSSLGRGKFFILEGDEYPSSNWDDSSKFLHYHPQHVLLTSLAQDHFNVFKTKNDYIEPYKNLLKLVPTNGKIVACIDGENIKRTIGNLSNKPIFYGLENHKGWHARNIKYGTTISFEIFNGSKKIVGLKTNLLGKHNVENILGVATLLFNIKAIRPDNFSEAIKKFRPLERRLDMVSKNTSVPIFEGFGSSREKTKSAIEALRLHYPNRKIVVLFEPHSFSWRNRNAISWYDDAFDKAVHVYIYLNKNKSSQSGELKIEDIIKRLWHHDKDAQELLDSKSSFSKLFKNIDQSSVLLILSSGSFGGMISRIIKTIEDKFPKNERIFK